MAEPKKTAGGRLFHVLHGESPFMYDVDRRNALNLHPGEWKEQPWTEEEIEAHNRGPQSQLAEAAKPAEPAEWEPEPEADDETQSRKRGGRSRK
jgi:hypothetical protein